MCNLNNYHNEIDNANNFLNQIIFSIVSKSKETLNCLQYNNVTIEDPVTLEPPPIVSKMAKSKDRKYECTVCQKAFYTLNNLKIHRKMHQEERPFSCDKCQATFKYKNSLDLHTKMHSDEKPWKCDVCGACFRHKNTLRNHATTHTAEKTFECNYCHMKFFQKQGLRAHVIIHANPNRFKCPYDNCGKMFNFKHHLKSHVKIHTGRNECFFFKYVI